MSHQPPASAPVAAPAMAPAAPAAPTPQAVQQQLAAPSAGMVAPRVASQPATGSAQPQGAASAAAQPRSTAAAQGPAKVHSQQAQEAAAVRIQSAWRGHKARRVYANVQAAVQHNLDEHDDAYLDEVATAGVVLGRLPSQASVMTAPYTTLLLYYYNARTVGLGLSRVSQRVKLLMDHYRVVMKLAVCCEDGATTTPP